MKLLLGSNSPRRNELLAQLGYSFTKVKIDCGEDFSATMDVNTVAGYLAEKKSQAYAVLQTDEILITADTVVIADGEILNKPADKAEATRMLQMLSGKSHLVQTGLCIRSVNGGKTVDTETTLVYVNELTDTQIAYYVDTYKPYDKAGAYGIQEWFGIACVSRIEGSYYNVVGLPTDLLFKRLNDLKTIKAEN
jgi:septum formation protein